MDAGRRTAIQALTRGVATAALALPAMRSSAQLRGDPEDLTDLSAVAAVERMRAGELSAETYALSLIRAFNRHRRLNVFISRDDSALLRAAKAADDRRRRGERLGALHGLPILIKDNIETAALPTSAGTPALVGRRTGRNAAVAQALFDAGALLAGKSNLHELAAGGDRGCVAGQVLNPYDYSVRTGGSSAGNGAALAARLVPAAIGTDTGGSVRIPASLCGTTALRPTFGRYAGYGIVPISISRDTAGPMARTVADLALLDGVITGGPTTLMPLALPRLRLGVARGYYFAILDRATASVIDDALQLLSDLGVVVVEAEIPGLQKLNTDLRGLIAQLEIGRDVPGYLIESGDDISMDTFIAGICNPQTKAWFAAKPPTDALAKQKQRQLLAHRRAALRSAITDYFAVNRLDAMIFPTTPLPARPVAQGPNVEIDGQRRSAFAVYNRNTMPGSSSGLPGVSVPAGLTPGGLPVGLGFDGPHGSDRLLLAIAAVFEKAMPPLPPPPTV